MENNNFDDESLNLVMPPDTSNMNIDMQELYSQIENLQLSIYDDTDEMFEMQTPKYYKFNSLARYLILKTTSMCDISEELRSKLNNVYRSEFVGFEKVVWTLSKFFEVDFDIILTSLGASLYEHDLGCASLILSRCVILIGEPSYFNFLLVAAFLHRVIYDWIFEVQCFRILPLSEFCCDVLFKRYFHRIFTEENVFENLFEFCHTFIKNIQESKLDETPVGKNYVDLVKKCIETTDAYFSLTDSEKEMSLDTCYLDCSLDCNENMLSGQMDKGINSYFDTNEISKVIMCEVCHSKCYSYLDIIDDFIN